jgi:TolB protein
MKTRIIQKVCVSLTAGFAALLAATTVHAQGAEFELVSTIAFTSSRDDPTNPFPNLAAGEIYLMNEDGMNLRRLTENMDGDFLPALSPDGKKIVFDSNRLRLPPPDEPLNTSDLFLMNTDGTEQTYLIRGSSATWSPDGKNIVFHASASGAGLPTTTDPGAATSDSDIFVANVDDLLADVAEPHNITNSSGVIDNDPDWSPDGTKIVYTAHSVNDIPPGPVFNYPTAEVFVIDVDGSGTPVQLTTNNEEERAAEWSPDGSKIVFMCRYGGSDFEICTINPDGSGLVQVTNNTVQELGIRWSVDGTQFWFNRPVVGAGNQLFKINADGTGETQMTNPPGINLAATPGLLRVHTDCP